MPALRSPCSATASQLATGPLGAYQPLTTINASQIKSTRETIMLPFSGQLGGNPALAIDKSKLILVLWQFNVPATSSSTAIPCIADITIDDVAFYK